MSAESVTPTLVELYGHADCCLCRTALEALGPLCREFGLGLAYRDIAADDALHRAYFERVPVVRVGGRVVCELVVEAAALRAALGAGLAATDGRDAADDRAINDR